MKNRLTIEKLQLQELTKEDQKKIVGGNYVGPVDDTLTSSITERLAPGTSGNLIAASYTLKNVVGSGFDN